MEVEMVGHAGITRLNNHEAEQSVGDILGGEG